MKQTFGPDRLIALQVGDIDALHATDRITLISNVFRSDSRPLRADRHRKIRFRAASRHGSIPSIIKLFDGPDLVAEHTGLFELQILRCLDHLLPSSPGSMTDRLDSREPDKLLNVLSIVVFIGSECCKGAEHCLIG